MTLRMAPSPLSPRCFWRAVCALAFAALAILPAALAQAQPTGTEAQVRAAFDTFKQSLTQRDGDTAIRYIDDGTAAMHERYRQLALKAPKDALLKGALVGHHRRADRTAVPQQGGDRGARRPLAVRQADQHRRRFGHGLIQDHHAWPRRSRA